METGSQAKPGAKDTNPKDAVGVKKAYLSTVPCPVLFELGGAMLEGACKYGRHNYRVLGVRASVYYDAAMRHIMAWYEGQDTDPDSGYSHLVKAMACLTILRDAQIRGQLKDDRPPMTDPKWMEEANKRANIILDMYPSPVAAFTAKDLDPSSAHTWPEPWEGR